ncbi:MAG: hypothetical protein IT353_01330 [Gemmatimonadaceae bacterium]|nr:hypothetical protein [Gemmatimonadaceae bacterium]
MLDNLLPTPLHPAIVHLPIALMMLVPFFAIGAMIVISRGGRAVRAWGVTTALLAALSVSAFVSKETGEDEEEKVESVVPDQALETHEDAADTFFILSLGVLGVAGVGLLAGSVGNVARYAASAGTLGLLVAGYNVGHSGGEIVYKYNAGSAYTTSNGGANSTSGMTKPGSTDDDDDDDDRK